MNTWTADGSGGDHTIWLASGSPHREKPWTADGWIGWFGFAKRRHNNRAPARFF